MNWHNWLPVYFTVGWIIRAAMLPTVLRRQFTPGASIAWLGIVFLHPYIGLGLYLLVGEKRLGRGRAARHRELMERYRLAESDVSPGSSSTISEPDDAWRPVALQARKVGRLPVVDGNDVEFLTDSAEMVSRLVADIEAAQSTVHLLYYIFCPDGTGERVVSALLAAQGRGVTCRVLADAYASAQFLGSRSLGAKLREGGVKVAAALPRSLQRRRDLRNHRKMAVIDGAIAYAGSQNLINADYGGRRGAPWVDLTGRFTGPILRQFAAVFAEDWAFETDELLPVESLANPGAKPGGISMQVVPTGPVAPGESYRRVLLGAIQSARRRLVITTPYFVPDDPTHVSLMMAADRGVDVTLILPQTPDQYLTAAVGRANYQSLLDAGIAVYLYRPGLIHSKTSTVDDTLALFGSANLDVRSFNLNFELSVLAYGNDVTQRLRKIQMNYVQDSLRLDLQLVASRATIARYADRAVSLVSPLL